MDKLIANLKHLRKNWVDGTISNAEYIYAAYDLIDDYTRDPSIIEIDELVETLIHSNEE
jgi:hypothetical protein